MRTERLTAFTAVHDALMRYRIHCPRVRSFVDALEKNVRGMTSDQIYNVADLIGSALKERDQVIKQAISDAIALAISKAIDEAKD